MEFGNRPLTPAQQFACLQSNPICFGRGTLNSRGLKWSFEARPSALSRAYAARIEFSIGRWPIVFIDSPDLNTLSGGTKLPHVYSQCPVQLCLYLPGSGEWRPSMRLDQAFVPWTYLWLEFFEAWLCDGVWRGGGVHPGEQAA